MEINISSLDRIVGGILYMNDPEDETPSPDELEGC